MDATHFDKVAKLFAERRLSRRQALRQGGTGLAAAGLAVAGIGALRAETAAQSASPAAGTAATPAATGGARPPETLFVQSYETGSLVPKTGNPGMYTLKLEHGLGDTIYFTSRPERTVGAARTSEFLKNFGFDAGNPPNAALIGHISETHENISVLELTNPQYDTSTNTATYDAKVLTDMHEVDLHFTQTPNQEEQETRNFTAAHLFIDDCADHTVYCKDPGNHIVGTLPPQGFCYQFPKCVPCGDLVAACMTAFPNDCPNRDSCYADADCGSLQIC